MIQISPESRVTSEKSTQSTWEQPAEVAGTHQAKKTANQDDVAKN